MIPLRLDEVAAATGGRLEAPSADAAATRVSAVTTDSRAVPDGSLFVALRAERDGHRFVPDAVEAGAVAVLVERPGTTAGDVPAVVVADTWQALADLAGAVRGRVAPTTVAITGSVGKTTTKDLTSTALASGGHRVVAARGSFNNELGVPLTCLAVEEDTEMLVLEIGSRGVGHIRSLMPLARPDVAVVTAVSAAHLETFGDVDTVARAKSELVEALDPAGSAVLNAADPRVASMRDVAPGRVVTFSDDATVAADVAATDVTLDRRARPEFVVHSPWGRAAVRLGLAGRHHVGNALAALAAAGLLGVGLEEAAGSLATATVSRWRSEVVEADGVVVLNDAYNANPSSTRAALDAVGAMDARRRWAVLGHMAELGASSAADHEAVGAYAAGAGLDGLVVVGDRAEDIATGAARAGMDPDRLWRVADAGAALDVLAGRVGDGDAVLVKASRVGGLEEVADGLLNRTGNGS